MKLSEAIDRLEVGETVWVKATVDRINNEGKYIRVMPNASFVYLDGHDEISLTEPQTEKVEVPDFVAEWLKTNKYSTDIYDLFQAVEYATDSDGFIPENWKWCGEFYDWVSQESDTLYILSDAIRYGYTVKPKRWVVRQGGSEVWYLQGFRNSLDEDIVKQWCSYEGCIKFTDKSKAEAVATLVDGSVEEV